MGVFEITDFFGFFLSVQRRECAGKIQIKFLGRDSRFWGLVLDEDCAGVWFSESER